ncbi:hypothetical protein [Palleronia caenipelagi]|uniref:Uncharacterized protein n=1 Tax=Palleronia caenipelagi TaxID=2489174 RepID=A0A547PMV2_9RHOB|nr:hypothetical protein [Palleronia caenipelagi]TRD15471.1 hypothetical protein FEV53_16280 [Palleronia caenipelagi]
MTDFTDVVVFGTQDGHFAEGTGLLGRAREFEDTFEFRGVLRSETVFRFGSVSYFRRVLASAGYAYNLIGALVPVLDRADSKGFLGVGLLFPDNAAAADDMTAACQQALDTLCVIRERHVDENGKLSQDFDPRMFLPGSSNSPLDELSLSSSEEIDVYLFDDEKKVPPGDALYMLQSSERFLHTMVLLTDSPSRNVPEMSLGMLREFHDELERERMRRREEEARREEQARKEEVRREEARRAREVRLAEERRVQEARARAKAAAADQRARSSRDGFLEERVHELERIVEDISDRLHTLERDAGYDPDQFQSRAAPAQVDGFREAPQDDGFALGSGSGLGGARAFAMDDRPFWVVFTNSQTIIVASLALAGMLLIGAVVYVLMSGGWRGGAADLSPAGLSDIRQNSVEVPDPSADETAHFCKGYRAINDAIQMESVAASVNYFLFCQEGSGPNLPAGCLDNPSISEASVELEALGIDDVATLSAHFYESFDLCEFE